eukprot:5452303-Prorocentrum_lima.AAC.1
MLEVPLLSPTKRRRRQTLEECLEDPVFADYYRQWMIDRPTYYPPELTDKNATQLQRSPDSKQFIPYQQIYMQEQIREARYQWARQHALPALADTAQQDSF